MVLRDTHRTGRPAAALANARYSADSVVTK